MTSSIGMASRVGWLRRVSSHHRVRLPTVSVGGPRIVGDPLPAAAVGVRGQMVVSGLSMLPLPRASRGSPMVTPRT